MRPSFTELTAIIKEHQDSIKNINEEISLANNEHELARLALTLDFYEGALLVAEEVMADTIDKGRGD